MLPIATPKNKVRNWNFRIAPSESWMDFLAKEDVVVPWQYTGIWTPSIRWLNLYFHQTYVLLLTWFELHFLWVSIRFLYLGKWSKHCIHKEIVLKTRGLCGAMSTFVTFGQMIWCPPKMGKPHQNTTGWCSYSLDIKSMQTFAMSIRKCKTTAQTYSNKCVMCVCVNHKFTSMVYHPKAYHVKITLCFPIVRSCWIISTAHGSIMLNLHVSSWYPTCLKCRLDQTN